MQKSGMYEVYANHDEIKEVYGKPFLLVFIIALQIHSLINWTGLPALYRCVKSVLPCCKVGGDIVARDHTILTINFTLVAPRSLY